MPVKRLLTGKLANQLTGQHFNWDSRTNKRAPEAWMRDVAFFAAFLVFAILSVAQTGSLMHSRFDKQLDNQDWLESLLASDTEYSYFVDI